VRAALAPPAPTLPERASPELVLDPHGLRPRSSLGPARPARPARPPAAFPSSPCPACPAAGRLPPGPGPASPPLIARGAVARRAFALSGDVTRDGSDVRN